MRKTYCYILFFRQLAKENKHLSEICSQETKQKKRLSLYNEELQWKLKQNSEVVNAILQGQTPSRKPLHGSDQSLSDESQFKTPSNSFHSRSLHTSSFNEKHFFTPSFDRTLSFRERSNSRTPPNNCDEPKTSKSNESFELDESPPNSPKVKGVVEKSDSVSWVLELNESPEILASRMVRRAGSFRNTTPPKSTPTKSPAIKRPRMKSNNLSLSSSSSAIAGSNSKIDRHRSKSMSLRDSQSPESDGYMNKSWQARSLSLRDSKYPESCQNSDVMCDSWSVKSPANGFVSKSWQSKSVTLRDIDSPEDYMSKSWHYCLCTSTSAKHSNAQDCIRDSIKLENNQDLINDVDVSLPKLPSEIRKKDPDSIPSLPSADVTLLHNFPKNSAGEAMISESNSEDECSSSLEERSPSRSDTETSEEHTRSEEGKKCSKLQYDLFLMTESATNSEIMEDSSSEDLES